MTAITRPENWDIVVNFAEAPRGTYKEIREARPDVATARKALADWLENIRIENCTPQTSYIESIKLKAPATPHQ